MTDVVVLTQLLRTGDDPFWSRLRSVVLARGFDPETVVLVESCEQGDMSEFGILVYRDKRVYQYALCSATGSWLDGNLVEWTDITDRWHSTPYKESIEEGLRLAQSPV